MALVALGDESVPEKQTKNETNLSEKSDETGRVISSPAPNKDRAGKSAKGKVKTSAMTSIEAEAEIVGLPYLKARETITVENIGKKFSGNWRITKIRHEISSSGYLCSLSLAKNDHEKKSNKSNTNSVPKQQTNTKDNKAQAVNKVKTGSNKPKKTQVDLNTGKVINNG